MPPEPKLWPEPRVTANAQLVAGYLGGALAHRDGMYRVHTLGNPLIVEHERGNRYRVTVEQISGEE